MSAVYNLEPNPTGKAILQTTAGDITLSLFAKQTPLACRNFLQHCLDGTYDNTPFHRLVPNFIIQGGDPTGSGTGGASAINDGEGFEDEFHSRLKFNRRGLLGCANTGTPGSNGSQFFFTLGATPELQGTNTLFGRVEGETIYNLMKMTEAELEEGTERPLYPARVTGAEVLVNPFEDMVRRVKEAPRTREDEGKGTKRKKKAAGKNVLSFGVGEEGEEDAAPVVVKKAKANPKLVAVEEETPAQRPAEKKHERTRKRKSPSPSAEDETRSSPAPKPAPTRPARSPSPSTTPETPARPAASKLDQTNAEIAALKASLKRPDVDTSNHEAEKPKNALESLIPSTSTRGRKRGKAGDEKGAFDMFKSFKTRLEGLPSAKDEAETPLPANGDHQNDAPTNGGAPPPTKEEGDDEAELCDLHFIANCQSCRGWDQPEADDNAEVKGQEWMAHKLSFARDTLGKDLEWKRKMEEIEVIDPREKARTIKEEERKGKSKGKGGEKVRDKGRS